MQPTESIIKQEEGEKFQPNITASIRFQQGILHYPGKHTFRLIRRPNNQQESELLVALMHVLKEGLPDMNLSFLYKSVFDARNQKIVHIQNQKFVGGMCINCQPKKYVKIQYMSVASSHRKKGFGSLLINVLKRLLQTRKIALLVVDSDLNSEGFYQKLGFSTTEFIKNQIWHNKNDVFVNVVKLQCLVHPHIDYFSLKQMLQKRKERLAEQLKIYYVDKNSYKNDLCAQKEGQLNEQTKDIQYFEVSPSYLNGLFQNGWNWTEYYKYTNTERTKAFRRAAALDDLIQMAQHQLQHAQFSNKRKDLKMISYRQPIDLDTILLKTKRGEFQSMCEVWEALEEFFVCAKYLYSKNERLMANLLKLEGKAREMRARNQ